MRLNLTGRLTAALIGVTLLALVCDGVIYQVIASNVFNDLVVNETSSRFTGQIVGYYQAHGSLAGIQDFFQQQHAQQVAQILGVGSGSVPQLGGAPNGAPQAQPAPAGAPSGEPSAVIAYGLVDTNGVVLLPAGAAYPDGARVPDGMIKAGVPIKVSGKLIGTAVLPNGPLPWSAEQQEYVRRTRIALVLASIIGVVLASVAGVLLARGILRPLRLLIGAVRRLRHEEAAAVAVSGSGELAELARGFNEMSEDLARAQQARRQLTADIAHELRNPLTVITGYVQALRDGELSATTERLEVILRETQRLQRAVDDLRTLSLADVGGLTLSQEPMSPAGLLQTTATSYALTAQQCGVQLSCEVDLLPEIRADEERLSQVLGNLVANALRHTPSGGAIRLSGRAEGSDVVLTVEDTGEGISPDELPHIFDHLFRAHGMAQRDRQGSGLGLAIVKALVTAHGGTIEVESVPGAGTTFTIRLPAGQRLSGAADEARELVTAALTAP